VEVEGDGDGEVVAEPARSRSFVLVFVLAGYGPSVLTASGPYLHGLDLALGAIIGTHLQVTVGAAIVQAAELSTPAGTAAYNRTPLRLSVHVPFDAGPVELGPVATVQVESWRVSELTFEPADADALRTHRDVGVGGALRLRLDTSVSVAPFIEAGVDVFFAENTVEYGGELLLRRSKALPRLCVGVALQPVGP